MTTEAAPAPAIDWHARYTQQAAWTAPLRQHLFARLGLAASHRILEVGCGTGAILASLPAPEGSEAGNEGGFISGLDVSLPNLRQAARHAPAAGLVCGDAHALPYRPASFDFVLCHFLVLWLARPLQALSEMARMLRPGGWLLALAEPDYGGRLDYPPELESPGRLQTEALRRQGAEPQTGRRLGALLLQTGLQQVETGVLAGQWQCAPPAARPAPDLEWQVLEADIAPLAAPAELAAWRRLADAARRLGSRLTFVPTFYAIGQRRPAD